MADNSSSTQSSSGVKKILPFILPLCAIAIICFLGYRWYNNKTDTKIEVPEISSKVEIEELNTDEQAKLSALSRGIGDYETLKLTPAAGVTGTAQVRYEITDGKVYASIIAALPEIPEPEKYQLWLKTSDAAEWQASQALELAKGGYMTTLALSQDKLPVEIKITHEGPVNLVEGQEKVLFTGKLEGKN